MKRTQSLHADKALLPSGWARDVRVEIGADGMIASVEHDQPAHADDLSLNGKILLPAPTNLHSHAFQRAMAGLTEFRSSASDDFWSWRTLMYRFLDQLTPEDVQTIAAQVQMEMLEAGYACCVEFHYLHHQPGGMPYDDVAEMTNRIAAAAELTGIGLTLLPVYYRNGGLGGRPPLPEQRRFTSDRSSYEGLLAGAKTATATLPGGGNVGVAPHSLRAVAPDELAWATSLMTTCPIHIHIAEQTAEVEEVQAVLGTRPVRWLLDNHAIDPRWCLIHATHMTPQETIDVAATGAVAGLCPITESNLGDGTFDGVRFVEVNGSFGIGSDSNVRITLSEELRTLEYSQRLRDRSRALLARQGESVGQTLFEGILAGGSRAAGRPNGAIAPGRVADLITLDGRHLHLAGLADKSVLDGFIFAGDDRLVCDTFVAGTHLVRDGRHHACEQVEAAFSRLICKLRSEL